MRPTGGCCPELLLRAGPPSPLWSTATLVQVLSVSCHRWRLAAGDISHKPLRLRCVCTTLHSQMETLTCFGNTSPLTQIATSPDAIPSLILSRRFSYLSKLPFIFFCDAINSLCLDALSVLSTLCAVYCEPMQSQ